MTDDNVVEFPGLTSLDISADKILSAATEMDLKQCVIVGRTKDDNIYFAFSMGYGPDCLWLLERAKQALMGTELEDVVA